MRPFRFSSLIPCVACLASLVSAPAHAADHPLQQLSAAELKAAFETVLAKFRSDPQLPDAPLRFPIAALSEPDKAFVRSWSAGKPIPRRAEVHVLHYPDNRSWVALVDVSRKKLVSLRENPAGTQPAVTAEEYVAADSLVRAHEPWRKAIAARGVDPDLAYVDVWAPGDEPLSAAAAERARFGQNTRLLRCLTFDRGAPLEALDPKAPQNPYDRPVEGVVVTLDMNARQVVDMTDTLTRPVITASGNALRSRKLRALRVQQPDGGDLQLSGGRVRWHGFQFYVSLHPREGLVISDLRYDDHGKLRPIAHRMALSEIYVPYGIGDENWVWRSAFDVGEYNAGTLAQTLEPKRDVPENARFLDAVVFSDLGPGADNETGSFEIPQSIALYEREAGILWTRTDPSSYDRDTRNARELVVTWNCWIGNYIYGFDWIFKLDGSIEVRVQLTGTTLNRGTNREPEASAPKVGRDARGVLVAAPNHQHFLSFRLDLDVDGTENHLMQMDVGHLPGTGFKNAFAAITEDIHAEGFRDVNPQSARHWHIESAGTKNAFGKPTAYALEPRELALPYSAPDFPGLQRAQFAQHQLWFTRYKDSERYAAGDFPNQAKQRDGVGRYSEPAEPLHDADLVLWYTTGFTHVARPEDFPVMASESIGWKLVPRGFFAYNPALDVADQGAD